MSQKKQNRMNEEESVLRACSGDDEAIDEGMVDTVEKTRPERWGICNGVVGEGRKRMWAIERSSCSRLESKGDEVEVTKLEVERLWVQRKSDSGAKSVILKIDAGVHFMHVGYAVAL